MLRKRRYGCWVYGEYAGILGYSDDILLLAPSTNALNEMVNTCESYANDHNLRFSTDECPSKSKTKYMCFVKRNRGLQPIKLCNNDLRWVNEIKHLGNVITNDRDIMAQDIMQKRAAYINRNHELLQEFHFAHPLSKAKINNCYNMSFYGSVLWNLFGTESLRLEKSWNVSVRKMFHLSFNAHRYFIEPISCTKHIMYSLYSRLVKFVHKIKSCNKTVMQKLLQNVKYDCRSNTGRNLRNIMLKSGKNCVDDINEEDLHNLIYHAIPIGNDWRLSIAKETIEYICGDVIVPGFDNYEMTEILNYVCGS